MECGHFHHLPCVSQWLFPGGGGGVTAAEGGERLATPPSTSCLLDVSSIALPKLNRKQKAVARWVEDGYSGYSFSQPPEVRVSRISLEERSARIRPHQPPPPQPPPAAASTAAAPGHRKATTHRSKRRARAHRNEAEANRLPAAVSEGRALGVQVQPLMAVLMSPRPSNECSPQNILDMESGGQESHSSPEPLSRPQLSVTCLELPPPAAPKSALPWRPPLLRGAARPLGHQGATARGPHSSRSLALDCSKMSLSSRLQRNHKFIEAIID
ncbi:uncharacterized protein LOC111058502 [Nilaparvata lugens]|uniref:uncharacterized protein LOC111058502 n=1 Tax=Nilaparvata lugens TaxID=108931 RepID=UPI00193DE8F3|nr:uncharacterized protein LOC111058502 [Nilaparvata lugens]